MMREPIEIVRSFYENLAQGNVAGVVAVLHPDLHWTEAQGFPYFTGTWRKPQDVVDRLLVPLARDWNDFAAIADDFIVDSDRVVSIGAYSGVYKKTGRAMRASFAHVWRIADDKIASFDMYTDTLLIRQAMD